MSDVLARAEIAVSANTSAFDKAMDALPAKAQKVIKKSVDAINAEMAKVGQALGQTTNAGDIKKLTDYQNQLKKSLDGVKMSAISQAQSLNPTTRALNAVALASGNSAYRMQLFAQSIDDLQYVPEQGLRPILNNLSQFAPELAIVGIAVDQLIRHWDKLAGAFGGSSIKTAAEELEELRQKANLTANEFDRVARADAIPSKVKELRGAKTVGQQSEEAAATTAIVNAGFKDVVAGLRATPLGKQLIDSQGTALGAKQKLNEAETYFAEQRRRANNPNLDDAARNRASSSLANSDQVLTDLKVALEAARNATAEDKTAQAAIIKDLGGRRNDLIELIRKNPKAFSGAEGAGPNGVGDKGLALARALELADPTTKTLANIGDILKNGIANAFQVEIPNKAKEAQQALTAGEKAAGVQAAGGLAGRLNPQLLKDIALGGTTNRELLATAIESGMKRAGFKDPKQYSAEAASGLIGNNEEAIRKRVLEAGGTREQAAQYLLAQNVDRLHAEANKNRPSLGVTDIEGYHREVQDSLLRGNETQALMDEQKRATDAYIEGKKALDDLTKTIKERGNGLVLK